MSNSRKRRTKADSAAHTRADSDSSTEEIIRPTLFEQIQAQQQQIDPLTHFNIKKIKIPLSQKLGQDDLIQDFTVEEYDVPRERTDLEAIDEDGVLGDIGQTFFLTVPLEILMIGFDVLVYKQYREEIVYKEILFRALRSFLPVWFLLYASHPRKTWKLVQLAFLLMAVVSGCWLVYSVNVNGYYAVMKKAPPLGTLMIWCVIEMDLLPSLATCAAVGAYVWWNGFTLL